MPAESPCPQLGAVLPAGGSNGLCPACSLQQSMTDQMPDFIEFVKTAPQSPRGKESMKILSRMGNARAAGP